MLPRNFPGWSVQWRTAEVKAQDRWWLIKYQGEFVWWRADGQLA